MNHLVFTGITLICLELELVQHRWVLTAFGIFQEEREIKALEWSVLNFRTTV